MKNPGKVLIVGGGIAGIQASLDLADRGFNVYLVEKTPSIGGHMAQLDKTFPTMDCSICILAPKMIDVSRRQNIKLLTFSEVKEVKGEPGKFDVKVIKKPRFVDESKCTGCGDCTETCPIEIPNEFELDLCNRKAIYRPFPQAIPKVFSIDKRGVPPCRATCPAGVNVQGYIALITQHKYREALELIRKDIPFPGVCGRVCYHPCEEECERGKVDKPIAINSLKRFLSDHELGNMSEKVKPLPKTRKEKVAVIGSGPAGLTAAYDLVKMGYSITVFESEPEPGGMLRVGIPEYRLPKAVLDADIRYIEDLGVNIRTNMRIGKELKIEDLTKAGYNAIFVATGAHESKKLNIDGENLKGITFALDFLKDANSGKAVRVGKKVAVIGGGNVAIDAARTALRLGSEEVQILYRRSRKEMTAYPEEVKQAEKEGVKIQFLVSPTRFLGKDSQVIAIECIRMKLGEPWSVGTDSRRRPTPIKGSEFEQKFNMILIAIGEKPNLSILPNGIRTSEWDSINVDPITLQTFMRSDTDKYLPHIFAGGDVVSGPSTAINSIAAGKRAAISIDRYLRGEDLKIGRDESIKIIKDIDKKGIKKKVRQSISPLPFNERVGNFREVIKGFTEDMALQEAERCLNCGGCSSCLECEKVCEPDAIIHNQKEEILELDVGAIIVSTGFTPFNPAQIKEYGYGKHKNVLTSMELERLLSASGPTGGKLVRPSDNKIAKKIAFIQCVGSRSLKDNQPYCSSVCCMYATKEAVIVKEHEEDSEVSIFYTDIRGFGKGFREFINRAKKEWDIRYFRAKPSTIREDPRTFDLLIRYEDTLTGKIKNFQVDLVVLCTALVPPPDNKVFAEISGIEIDEYGFFQVGHTLLAPLNATKPGIFLSGCCHNPQDIPDSIAEAKGAAARAAEFLARRRY